MDFFLSKSDRQKLELLVFIEQQPQQVATLSEIQKKLSFSKYMISKSIQDLTEDFKQFNLTGFDLYEEDKKIFFSNDGTNPLKKLQLYYLHNSQLFSLFDAIFKNPNFSIDDYSLDIFLSISKVYVLRNELDLYLNTSSIKISSHYQLTGDEIMIRNFIFTVYFHYFNSLEYPFSPEVEEITDQFSTEIAALLGTDFLPTQSAILKIFLSVLFQRLNSGQSVSFDEISMVNSNSSLFLNLVSLFEHTVILSSQKIQHEVAYLITFLISKKLVSNLSELIDINDQHFKQNLAFHLSDKLNTELSHIIPEPLSKESQSLFMTDLLCIHFDFIYFNQQNHIQTFKKDPQFLLENYPEYFSFVSSFISSLKTDYVFFEHKSTQTLFYEYMFLFIQYLPIHFFSLPLIICVDFSQGSAYNHFIKENIISFRFLNIQVENTLTEKTDLYLSDLFTPNLSVDTIIWRKPPLATDWKNFGNKVIELKGKKRSFIHEEQPK